MDKSFLNASISIYHLWCQAQNVEDVCLRSLVEPLDWKSVIVNNENKGI